MQINTVSLSHSQVILRPSGRVDVESSADLRQAILNQAKKKEQVIVVDLSDVEFMDSSGLSALVSGMKALQKTDGQIAISNARPQVRIALRLTMLDKIFPVYASPEEALHALTRTPSRFK